MSPRAPEEVRDRARQTFCDALEALEFDQPTRVALVAAAESWARAERAWAIAQFINTSKSGAVEHVS